jgi:plastocyanin
MRTIFKLILLAAIIYGGWYIWKNYDIPTWYKTVKAAIENRNTKGALVLPKKRGESQKDTTGFYIKNCVFSPSSLSVNKGEKISWYNQDSVDRQVIGDVFDSGLINPAKSYSKIFYETGTFDFSCDGQTANKGQIIVK